MFGFLKDKLKGAINKFSKNVDEEADEEIIETPENKAIEKVEEIVKEEEQLEKIVEQAPDEDKEEAKAVTEEIEKELEEEKAQAEDELAKIEEEKKDFEIDVKNAEELIEEVDSEEEFERELEDIEDVSRDDIYDKKRDDISDASQDIDQSEVEVLEQETEILDEEEILEEVANEAPEDEKEVAQAVKEEIEKELEEERFEKEDQIEEVEEKKSFFKKFFTKKSEVKQEESKQEAIADDEPIQVDTEFESVQNDIDDELVLEKKKGIFGKLKDTLTKKVSDEKFEEFFWDIEIAMLENNVSLEVIEKIKDDMRGDIVGNNIPKSKITEIIIESLKTSITSLFDIPKVDLMKNISEKKPYIISFIGVNGSGKTTNLAKVAKKLQDEGKSVVIAACDTFRSAAIQQLEEHANKLGIRMIKHDYGADSAAVAYDAIEHAKAKGIDVVLIDTAGRLHSNDNLMAELSKLVRVANPDLNIFVGESITGNDCVEQATKFGEAVRIDAIILTKADVDDKGGAAISISYVTGKPILYLGMGQEHTDLKEFDAKIILDSLDL